MLMMPPQQSCLCVMTMGLMTFSTCIRSHVWGTTCLGAFGSDRREIRHALIPAQVLICRSEVEDQHHLTNQYRQFEAGVFGGESTGSPTHHVMTAPLDTLHLRAADAIAEQH